VNQRGSDPWLGVAKAIGLGMKRGSASPPSSWWPGLSGCRPGWSSGRGRCRRSRTVWLERPDEPITVVRPFGMPTLALDDLNNQLEPVLLEPAISLPRALQRALFATHYPRPSSSSWSTTCRCGRRRLPRTAIPARPFGWHGVLFGRSTSLRKLLGRGSANRRRLTN